MRKKFSGDVLENILSELEKTFGKKLSRNESVRAAHSHEVSSLGAEWPDAVLYAESADDVVKAVSLCHHHAFPVIPFAAGSSLEGQLNAPFGGLSLDLSKMDKVVSFAPEDMTITVEPGITREALNSWLRDSGLFFPIDPGANATLGGMAATRASGTNAVRYGTLKDTVLCAKAVMADGRLIRTASRAKKSAAGYDLTRLLVGSEGTLGIFTELTIKLQPIPETVASGVCTFPSIGDACEAVIEVIQCAIPVARVELMDEYQVAACNAYSGTTLAVRPTLCVEFHGDAESVKAQSELFGEIISGHGSSDFDCSTDPEKRAKLWKMRHDAFWASSAAAKGAHILSTDVCVPISRLADCVTATQEDLITHQLSGPIVGHVGDGNFHVLLSYDDNGDGEKTAKEFTHRLALRAIEMGGTCTGEHGVGQRKARYFHEEMGEAVDFMFMIKQALDPKNILNPGKYGFPNY